MLASVPPPKIFSRGLGAECRNSGMGSAPRNSPERGVVRGRGALPNRRSHSPRCLRWRNSPSRSSSAEKVPVSLRHVAAGRCVQSRICRTLGSPPKVSYRNDLRQWKRSEDGHVGRGEPRLDKGGKGGKAKGGEIFRKSWQLKLHSDRLYRKEKWKLLKTLANAGYPEFPDHIPTCGGSISDINTGRLSVSSTRKLIEGLSSCQEPTAALASALMTSFLKTRKGLNGEDLLPKLGPVTAGYWYKFPFTAPNKLDISDDQADTGFHGTHLECMHAILATGMLLPSDPGIIGTRACADRGGVYLHRPINRHLAEN